MPIPSEWLRLGFTSGRRTHKGNRLVGGMPDSSHLRGTAADFTAPLSAVRRMFPNNRIIDEGDHRHVSGLSGVPYYGRRGTAGLVDGVDTTAPKGKPPVAQYPTPYYPRRLGDIAKPDLNAPMAVDGAQPMPFLMPSDRTLGDIASLPQGNIPKHKGLFPGKDIAAIGMILGDALRGLSGQEPIFAPMELKRRSAEEDRTFDREKLNAEIEERRARAMEPPQFIQNLQAYMAMPDEARREYLSYLDATNPIAVSGPQGTQRVPRTLGPRPGTVEDGFVFLGGDPADPSHWRPQ